MLYSWTRHSTLTVPLSTHVYKWIPENNSLMVQGRITLGWMSIIQGEVEILHTHIQLFRQRLFHNSTKAHTTMLTGFVGSTDVMVL